MKTSESISLIAKALVSAKKDFAPALKATTNPAFKSKYADLETLIEATDPALLKHGLVLMQSPHGNVERRSITIVTRIVHESGEWIEGELELPALNRDQFNPQSVGSATTYGRRYSLMGMLGIAGEDDDGNAASQPQPKAAPREQQRTSGSLNVTPKKIEVTEHERFGPSMKVFFDGGWAAVKNTDIFERVRAMQGQPAQFKVEEKLSKDNKKYLLIVDVLNAPQGTELNDDDIPF